MLPNKHDVRNHVKYKLNINNNKRMYYKDFKLLEIFNSHNSDNYNRVTT